MCFVRPDSSLNDNFTVYAFNGGRRISTGGQVRFCARCIVHSMGQGHRLVRFHVICSHFVILCLFCGRR